MSEKYIRCFIALTLPDEVKTQISTYVDDLKRYSRDVRWIKGDNIHLTLKFLGEIDSKRVEMVKKCLYPLSNEFSQFTLTISGSGSFPDNKRPRVFWLGMEQSAENPLSGIHKWIENQLFDIGFEKEKRRFSPHLTLGRVRTREKVDFSDLLKFLDNNPFIPVRFQVNEIHFIQSFLKPTGAEYQVIELYTLR